MESHHFLIADDQAIVRNLVRGTLSRLGVRSLSFADSGEEAIRVLTRLGGSITFVIADWNMGPVDGLQLLKRIRTGGIAGVSREMSVILLTAHSAEPIITAAANLDVSAFLVKPVSAQRLEDAVHFAISRSFVAKPAALYERIDTVEPSRSSGVLEEGLSTHDTANAKSASSIRSQVRGDADK